MSTAVGYIRNKYWHERLLRSPWFWSIFLSLSFGLPLVRSLMRKLPDDPPVLFKIPDFKLVDEEGATFDSHNLDGKFYVASFMFTTCKSVCPRILRKLQIVQKRLRGLGDHVRILSFSVDPETDTPELLFKKARSLEANPYIWKFLTGPKEEIKNLLVKGFKVPMGEKTATSLMDVAHSQKLVLVDNMGMVRGYYSIEDADINKLVVDTGILANKI